MKYKEILFTAFGVSIFTLISADLSHAESYTVRLGKKNIQCQIINEKPVASVKVGNDLVSMKQRIKDLNKLIKKAKTADKKLKLSRSLAAIQSSMKSAQRACAAGMPDPKPSPTPAAPDYLSLEPYQGAVTKETVRLFTERAGYGLSSHEDPVVALALSQGLDSAVREFMRIKEEPATLAARVRDRFDNTLGNAGSGGAQVSDNRITVTNGYARADLDFAVHTNNPFRSNLQHFFFGLWTMGSEVLNNNLNNMAPQTPLWWDYWTDVLYKSALNPKIPDRLLEVARHPAMLIYLSNDQNLKGNVNENFARELMELFSMGTNRIDRSTNQPVANYIEFRDGDRTRGDIYRAARCLTGWRVSLLADSQSVLRWRSVYSAADHEDCAATMFEGQSFAYSISDDASLIAGIFANHPAPRDYIAREVLKWFLTPNPPIELVRALGDRIHAAGYDLTEPLHDLFMSKAFYDPAYINTVPKTPHQLAVEFIRTTELFRTDSVALNLEGGANIGGLTGDAASAGNLYRMNYQTPLPTDVFFFRASEWFSSSAQLETANMIFNLLADTTTQARTNWLPEKFLSADDLVVDKVVTNVSQRYGCSQDLTADMRQQLTYYLNNSYNGTTYTRALYDNVVATHRSNKGRYLASFFAMQPCFRLK